MKRVAIVGGGVAGVTAAYELAQLARRGAPLQGVLFEASHATGRNHRDGRMRVGL
jgi:oxygen-dependent protoporphyrinogen oxidase